MKTGKVIQVFGKCREMVKILKLYNLNVTNIFSFDNLYASLATIPVILNFYLVIMLTWFMFDHGFILSEISSTMPIVVGHCQILLVSFSIIEGKGLIYDAVDHLQILIEKRSIFVN